MQGTYFGSTFFRGLGAKLGGYPFLYASKLGLQLQGMSIWVRSLLEVSTLASRENAPIGKQPLEPDMMSQGSQQTQAAEYSDSGWICLSQQ